MTEDREERFHDKRAAARMGDGLQDEAAAAEAGTGTGEGQAPSAEAAEDWKQKADEYYAHWQRSTADFINLKRRVEEEKKEWARIANATLVINLLPVLDDLERAVDNVDAKLAGLNWVQGVEAIYRKFRNVFEHMGVEEIPAEGQVFDPVKHEAVGEQPGDEGRVLHVAQKGYLLGGKVIRPAMVIVGNGQQADA